MQNVLRVGSRFAVAKDLASWRSVRPGEARRPSIFEGQTRRRPSDSRRAPPPIDTRNLRAVTSAFADLSEWDINSQAEWATELPLTDRMHSGGC
ncbi:hypothetical protein EVAR_99170_1 [Eumeta japonica]|uniref:Uncharacterized protein n=1 Tax=Eumeta variegata TaxID=151549 RepID=A0A4C1T6E1_EUMVA|nr:hypothetical protein EVAR_99170_1 [Eumeta japonica]